MLFMAAKKKTKKKVTHRHHGHKRHKMGAIQMHQNINIGEFIGGLFLGAVGTAFANIKLATITAIPPKATGLIEVGGGMAGGVFIKNSFFKGLTLGVGVMGIPFAAHSFGVMGIGVVNKIEYRKVGASDRTGLKNVAGLGDSDYPKPSGVGKARQAMRQYYSTMEH